MYNFASHLAFFPPPLTYFRTRMNERWILNANFSDSAFLVACVKKSVTTVLLGIDLLC